jgi:hypothetical protein
VSAPGLTQRLAVFAVFAALAATGSLALSRGTSGSAAPLAELEAVEAELIAGARLHPAWAPASPKGSGSSCAECHAPPPHPSHSVRDTVLNAHAGQLDCLVCHWSAVAGARPAPSWQVQAGSAFLAALPAARLSKEGLGALRSAVTARGRRCFERGPGCRECHRSGGMGALLRPGTAPQRTAALESLENYFTLAPGEKWYFPQLQ